MTKQWIKIAVLAGVLAAARLCMAADVTGNWVASTGTDAAAQFTRVTLKTDGTALSGMWGALKIEGTLTDGKLEVKLTDGQGNAAGALTGTISGDSITATGTVLGGGGGRGGRGGGGGAAAAGLAAAGGAPAAARGGGGGRGGAAGGPATFTLTRAATPPAKARSIDFSPNDDQIFGTYSAANKPALHIFPGDIVHTWTPDAGGVDAKGVRHRGGDSNIGPFYVEGALPGDTLVLHLLKVRTNRSTAHQGTRINAHAVTAAYLVGAQYDPAVTGDWTLLPEKGIAVPTHPSEHMKNYSVPLKPMLGCISVAPQGDQQYRGGDLGPFGGNMDYNDNVEGTTL
jgi:amidase